MSMVSSRIGVLLFICALATDAEARSGSHGRPVQLPAACRADSLSTKDVKAAGIRVVVAQFASSAKTVAKFLAPLSDKYLEAVRVTFKQPLQSRQDSGVDHLSPWQAPVVVTLVPCAIPSQEAASLLASQWHVDAVLWGLVGVEESSAPPAGHGIPSGTGNAPPTGTGNVFVSGAVVTSGSSLACIGNNNDCRLYMFQAHGHPLQEPVVPVLTMRQPGVSQEWDHDDTIKDVISVARSDTPSVLSRVQRAMLQVLAARSAMTHKKADIAYQLVDSALRSTEQDERIPLGDEPILLLADSAFAIDDETTESRALAALDRCPEQDTHEHQCRASILRGIAKRAELRGKAVAAVSWYEKARDQLKLAHDVQGESSVLRRLAWLAILTGQPGPAEKHYRETLSLMAAFPRDDGIAAVVRNDLGLLLAARSQGDEAQTLFEQAIAIHAQRKDSLGEALTHYNFGFLLRSRGRFDAAQQEFLRASECYEQVTPAAIPQALESVVEAAYLSRRRGKLGSDSAIEKKLLRLRSILALYSPTIK